MLEMFWRDFMLRMLWRGFMFRVFWREVKSGHKIKDEVMFCVAMGSLLMSHIPAGHEVRFVPCALWTVVLRLAES